MIVYWVLPHKAPPPPPLVTLTAAVIELPGATTTELAPLSVALLSVGDAYPIVDHASPIAMARQKHVRIEHGFIGFPSETAPGGRYKFGPDSLPFHRSIETATKAPRRSPCYCDRTYAARGPSVSVRNTVRSRGATTSDV